MRVALHLEQLRDSHGPGAAHAPEVVAGEVDEHQVLGALLLVGLELVRERIVGRAVGVAAARARDRLERRDAGARERDVRLRRGRHDLAVAEVAEDHVGRRVDGAQRAVERERARGRRARDQLRRHHLEDVAALDVHLRGAHHRLVVGGRALGIALAGAAQGRHGLHARGQRPEQVGAERVGLAVVAGLRDHLQRLAHVIEGDDDGREQEAAERRVVALAHRRQRDARLERRARVVGEVADDAAAERGQAGEVGVPVAGERVPQRARSRSRRRARSARSRRP